MSLRLEQLDTCCQGRHGLGARRVGVYGWMILRGCNLDQRNTESQEYRVPFEHHLSTPRACGPRTSTLYHERVIKESWWVLSSEEIKAASPSRQIPAHERVRILMEWTRS